MKPSLGGRARRIVACRIPPAVRASAALAICLTLQPARGAAPADQDPASAAVPPAVQQWLEQAGQAGFAGEVLIARGAQVVAHVVLGQADPNRGRRHVVNQAWPWCSVSKQVVAALVLRQVDAGTLALDDTVARYLPAFHAPAAGRITLRQLLMHLSGLPNPDDTPVDASGIPAFYRDGTPSAGLAFCAGVPRTEPGQDFQYNNCDTLVLGAVLEAVEGRPLARQIETELAAPLGLGGLHLAAPDEDPPIRGYDATGSAVPAPRLARFGASGALIGTAAELLAFDRALLAHRLVSAASTAVMWTGEPRWGYVALGAWAFPARLSGCAEPVALVERRGDIGGVQVRNILAPALDAAVIVFTNRADFEFGEIWQGRGFAHGLLSAVLCH